MHVIWKRPDGFHGAEPKDFRVIDIGHSKLWLHRQDRDQFPFRIAGGWEADDATKRLNNLTNLLGDPEKDLLKYLVKVFHNSVKDDAESFFKETVAWLRELKTDLKGDHWEKEILERSIDSILKRVEGVHKDFIAEAERSK